MSLRGVLRGFGLKVGPTTPHLSEQHPGTGRRPHTVDDCRGAARGARHALRTMAEAGETSSITSAPRSSRPAVDDRTSKAVGAHFGLTLKKYQSGKTDVTG